MFKSTSSPGIRPDEISPIYQKVLGCQLSSVEPENTSAPDLNMTDPTAALRSFLSTGRPFRNELSMTIPTSTVFSYTPGDSFPMTDTSSGLPSLVKLPTSILVNDHAFLSDEQTSCNVQRDASLLQKQEQFKLFNSDSLHVQEKDFESISRSRTNVLSPLSDSRLSEGDQTVPHSVSPVMESPGFALTDESSTTVQATFVPPPEVLEMSNRVSLKPVSVDDLQIGNLDNSLDNYEYSIHKVDLQLRKTQDTDKSPRAKLEAKHQSDEPDTDSCLKSTRYKLLENTPVHVEINKDKMSKGDESAHDVVIASNKTCDDIMDSKITCENNRTESITLEEDKRQNESYEGATESIRMKEDEIQKQLDEEQSEMRRYYLEADMRPVPIMTSTDKETLSYLSRITSELRKREIQNAVHVTRIHSTGNYNEMERKADSYNRIQKHHVSKTTSDVNREHARRTEACSERDHHLPWKESQEKRYYLKDRTFNKEVEPGEIIQNSSDHVFRTPPPCFNVSLENTGSHTSSGLQTHSCLTEDRQVMSVGYGEHSFVPETSTYVNPPPLQIPSERHRVDYYKYVTGYQNASFLNPSVGERNLLPATNGTTSQNNSSILFPVNINNGNLHEMLDATRCTELSLLKGKLHERHDQKFCNKSSSSSLPRYGNFQHKSRHWGLAKNEGKYSNTATLSNSKSCSKTSAKITLGMSRYCSNETKHTKNHLNGIIDKLWVSKTCNQNSSSITNNKNVLKSKCSKDMTYVLDIANARKSERKYVKMFQCSTCGFQDKEYSGIEKHIVEKHKPDGCTCDSCGETLVNHCQCQGRIKISSKAIIFACSKCKKICRTRFGLRRHKANVHGSDTVNCLSAYQPPYTCMMCHEDQHTYTRYKQHMVNHGVNNPFKCQTCGKSFHSKNGLALHFAKVHRLRYV